MKKVRKYFIVLVMILSTLVLTSCGMSGNKDFDYMTEKSILKISIQSTRDQSYKFIVTDKDVIGDIYKILSNGMVVDKKSTIEPDYILRIYESPTDIKEFKYIAGLDKKDGGNLYDGQSQYIISNRLDNDIIKNFTTIRQPIDFDKMYYNSIIKCVQKYQSEHKDAGEMGVNILEDQMALRFQLSTEIEDFKAGLSKLSNVKYIDDKKSIENYNLVVNVNTQGYTTKVYKAIVTFKIKGDTNPQQYYINNKYENGAWEYDVTQDMPENF